MSTEDTAVFNDDGPPLTKLQNLARVAKGLALLFFLLPWVTVSCGTQPLMSVKGVSMMTGNMMMTDPMTGEATSRGDGANIFVLAAFVILAALLVLGFVWKNRAALVTGLVGCLASIASLIFGVVVTGQMQMAEARAELDKQAGASPSGTDEFSKGLDQMGRDMANQIHINYEIGYWLTLIAIAAAAYFYWAMMKGKGNLSKGSAATPPAPPMAPPSDPVA